MLIVLLLLIACGSTSDEEVVTRKEAGLPSEPARTPPVVVIPSETAEPASAILSADIAALVDKGKAQTNYKYSFASRSRNQYGNYDEATKFDLYYKEGLAKKVYASSQRRDTTTFYNEVYIDFAKKKAVGVCNSATVLCGSSENKAYPLEYDQERPVVLLHLLDAIGSDARKLRVGLFDQRSVMVIEYSNWQGKREQLFIDTYYGLPLQQETYITQGDEQILEKRNSFTTMVVGSIKNKDVTLPENYVLQ